MTACENQNEHIWENYEISRPNKPFGNTKINHVKQIRAIWEKLDNVQNDITNIHAKCKTDISNK